MGNSTATEKTVVNFLLNKASEIQSRKKDRVDKRITIATAKELLVAKQLGQSLKQVFKKGWSVPPRYNGKQVRRHDRIVNILLSDLHIGASLSSLECPNEYGAIQESRRLGRVAIQVADYKRQYRQDTKLVVHLLGDIIQGQIHGEDSDAVAAQFATATHYLIQLLMFWCSQYPKVEVYCTPGNHGRNPAKHALPAIEQKWDGFETMLYSSVKAAVLNSGIENCSFTIPKTPYYIVDLFGNKLFGTHGDTVLRPGLPGRSINVGNLTQQIQRWNTATDIGGPFQIFACGHIHTGSIVVLPGNVTMVTNGALLPTDSYALSIGQPDVSCGQWLFESTREHVVGDQRFIVVNGAEKDPKYNKIITPLKGL
jgi:hypothetical protein